MYVHVNASDGKGAPTLGLDGDRIREDVHVRICNVHDADIRTYMYMPVRGAN